MEKVTRGNTSPESDPMLPPGLQDRSNDLDPRDYTRDVSGQDSTTQEYGTSMGQGMLLTELVDPEFLPPEYTS